MCDKAYSWKIYENPNSTLAPSPPALPSPSLPPSLTHPNRQENESGTGLNRGRRGNQLQRKIETFCCCHSRRHQAFVCQEYLNGAVITEDSASPRRVPPTSLAHALSAPSNNQGPRSPGLASCTTPGHPDTRVGQLHFVCHQSFHITVGFTIKS